MLLLLIHGSDDSHHLVPEHDFILIRFKRPFQLLTNKTLIEILGRIADKVINESCHAPYMCIHRFLSASVAL